MDTNPLPEYTEEIPLGYLRRQEFFTIAQKAVEDLGWQIASVLDHEIICHTPGGNNSFGESVIIRVDESSVRFYSKSANEYYWTDNQNKINAELFKQSFSNVVAKSREMERKLKFAGKENLGALVPSKTYLVTPVLIYVNVLVFILMVIMGVSIFNPDTHSLLGWGGNFRPLTKNGQWWRLLTYMFLHGGIIHLLMNMYALLYIGMFLEPLLGKFRFVTAYLLTGICAGLLSVVIHPFTVAVGASGAIFGMYGVFLALLTTSHIERTARNTMLRSILFFVVFNLVYGLQGNIDNAAHIGGLLSGIITGYVFYPGIKHALSVKHQAGVVLAAVLSVLLLSAVTLHFVRDDSTTYENKMKKFSEIESMALEVFKMKPGAPKAEILYNLKERGIYYWKEDEQVLNEIKQLDLPQKFKDKNDKLIQYCQLRVGLYELIYKKVNEETDMYDGEIKTYGSDIDKLIQELKSM
jgi:rhomboid protease GluP